MQINKTWINLTDSLGNTCVIGWVCGAWSGLVSEVDRVTYGYMGGC